MLQRAGYNSRKAPGRLRNASGLLDASSGGRESAADLPGDCPKLADYVKRMGFTHVEFLPVMEHPFYGSGAIRSPAFLPHQPLWNPQDFMYLIDRLHQEGIGVILDWVPSHIPSDEHGLGFFDGTHLYEHEDPRQGIHPDWNSFIFNYGRNEVRSFLLSNALSGWRPTISMVCAWMPWLPCFTWIIPARRGMDSE